MNVRRVAAGRIIDADWQALATTERYFVRIEATARAAAFLFALGISPRYVGPEQDSGRAWYEFDYSEQLDDEIKRVVDLCGDLVYHQPMFGQLALFDEDAVA